MKTIIFLLLISSFSAIAQVKPEIKSEVKPDSTYSTPIPIPKATKAYIDSLAVQIKLIESNANNKISNLSAERDGLLKAVLLGNKEPIDLTTIKSYKITATDIIIIRDKPKK